MSDRNFPKSDIDELTKSSSKSKYQNFKDLSFYKLTMGIKNYFIQIIVLLSFFSATIPIFSDKIEHIYIEIEKLLTIFQA